jgi:hypothetical protein
MLSAIWLLISASGATWKQDTVGAASQAAAGDMTIKVSELLNSFVVGTEQSKKRSLGALPDPSETKPFWAYTVVNPACKMKE